MSNLLNNSDELHDPTAVQHDPALIYPTATSGFVDSAETVKPIDSTTAINVSEKPANVTSIVFGILLLLTFFSPLGPVLFLPMIVVGIIVANRAINGGGQAYKDTHGGKTNPVILAVKVVFSLVMVFVLGIIGLIAFFFIGVSTGLIEFRMGS